LVGEFVDLGEMIYLGEIAARMLAVVC